MLEFYILWFMVINAAQINVANLNRLRSMNSIGMIFLV